MKKLILILLSILLIGCAADIMEEEPFSDRPMEGAEEEGIMVTSSGVMYLVHPSKIIGGGPPKDGIPSIDNPKYVSVSDADEWIQDNELILAMIYIGVKRVY